MHEHYRTVLSPTLLDQAYCNQFGDFRPDDEPEDDCVMRIGDSVEITVNPDIDGPPGRPAFDRRVDGR
jgi:hypothetical protein